MSLFYVALAVLAVVAGAAALYGLHRLCLWLEARGHLYYLNKQPIVKANALPLLEAEFKKHPDDKVLFLKADKRVAYKEVLEVMALAKKAGAFVIAAVSECKPGVKCSTDIVDDKSQRIAQ